MSYRVTQNTKSNYVPMEGRKNGSLAIRYEFGLEIFFLYRVIDNLEIKFWVKNTFQASYSRAAIA